MTKQLTLLSIITFISIFSACNPESKFVEIRNKDGILMEKYEVNQDSIKHGIYNSYYEDGQIFESAHYNMGILEGGRNLYFPDGTLEIEENYMEGTIQGSYNTYYKNGKPNVQCMYNQGVLEGLVKKFYDSGELMEEVSFQENLENGPFTEYYKNGSPKWKGSYINGNNEVGELDSFDLQGELMKKMMCGKFMDQYICQTIWTKDSGDVQIKLQFDAD